jgi:hypothetical protein
MPIVVRRQIVLVIVRVKLVTEADLVLVAGAFNPLGFGFRASEGGQQQSGQDRNDGDHDEQFNERKTGVRRMGFHR